MAKILVVDDDSSTTKMMKSLLKKMNHEVITSNDGEEALDKAKSERPDIIITDIMMPIVDGWELVELLKESTSTREIPTIVMSSSDENRDLVKVQKLGCFGFLKKPVFEEELNTAIQQILESK